MTKKEKLIVGIGAAFTLAAGAASVVLITGSKPQQPDYNVESAVKINADDLLTELKVGRYYLQNGTDDEYIEVFSDGTMCLFGYAPPDDATDIQRKSAEQFTTRRYYALSDKVKHIGLGDTPSPENQYKSGYGYIDENCITFSSVNKGKLNYIYRNE